MTKLFPIIMFCLLANHCDASENKALKLLIENRSCNGCNLSKLNLGWYNLFKVDLSEADLSESYLVNVDLSNANLSSSDLSNTYMNGANLSDATLVKTNLSGAELELEILAKHFLLMLIWLMPIFFMLLYLKNS